MRSATSQQPADRGDQLVGSLQAVPLDLFTVGRLVLHCVRPDLDHDDDNREDRKNESRIELTIEGMHCASCVSKLEAILGATTGVLDAGVNLATEEATVTYAPAEAGPANLLAASERPGYLGRTVGEVAEEESQHERRAMAELRTLRRRVGFAVAAIPDKP
ncbi:MAG: cation transporter [bacterium]